VLRLGPMLLGGAMLKSLHLKNFKGWKDTGKIEFAPITLFLGSNSSGKSSIGHFLMLLQQSRNSQDRKSVLILGDKTTPIELGGPIDMLYEHNIDELLDFEYSWDLSENLEFKDTETDNAYSADSLSFSCQIGVHDKMTQALEIERMLYKLYKESEYQCSLGMERVQKPSSARAYKILSSDYPIKRNTGRAWEMPSPYHFYGFPDEIINYFRNAWFAPQLNILHEKILSSISNIGPLRERAERHYRWTGFVPSSVGITGKDTIWAILAARAENRQYNFKYKQPLESFEVVIAKAMQKTGLIDEFKLSRVSEERQDYDVKVKTKGSTTFTDIPDVGFGVSQVLPVLVQLYYAPCDSIIIMEQPELHLHPNAQSALADIMIDAIMARENARPRNIQLIIETHSEHFLRRFQRRIAEGKLPNDSFAAYFANNDYSPTILEPLQMNLLGEITNWPNNFFGDINGDIFAQATAALKQQIKRR
jgi:hypothetical protein